MARSRVADYETTGRLKIILEEAAYEASSTSPGSVKYALAISTILLRKPRRIIAVLPPFPYPTYSRSNLVIGNRTNLAPVPVFLRREGGREKRWRREFVGRILDKNPTTFRGGSGGFSNGAGIKLQGGEGKIPRQEEGEQVGFDVP